MVRRYRARAKSGYLLPQKWAIGLITSVFLLAALVESRELFYFSNGSGEADWRIGEPTVTLWTAVFLFSKQLRETVLNSKTPMDWALC